jgi:hypothetical protein
MVDRERLKPVELVKRAIHNSSRSGQLFSTHSEVPARL